MGGGREMKKTALVREPETLVIEMVEGSNEGGRVDQ
jgi:hypothetical protein